MNDFNQGEDVNWEAVLAQEGLAPVEPGDSLPAPPLLDMAWHQAQNDLGETAERSEVADATVKIMRAQRIGVKAVGFRRWSDLREFLDSYTPRNLASLDDPQTSVEEPPTEENEETRVADISSRLIPEEIKQLMAPLDEREREILAIRFGVDRGEPRSLDEVAEYFNLTRMDIRKIEARAMHRLRYPDEARSLRLVDSDES